MVDSITLPFSGTHGSLKWRLIAYGNFCILRNATHTARLGNDLYDYGHSSKIMEINALGFRFGLFFGNGILGK